MIIQGMIKEIEHEGAQTKRVLDRIPVDNLTWKPHEKSKEVGQLAIHVAQTPAWTSRILAASDFDVLTLSREMPVINDNSDLTKILETRVQQAVVDLQKATDEELMGTWTFRRGEHVIFSLPRVAAIRSLSMNHLVHHRGQLTVYLRLLNIPVPGMYGPSADEI